MFTLITGVLENDNFALCDPSQNLEPRHFILKKLSAKTLKVLTLSLPNVAKGKFRPDFQISFCKILKNKQHHV